MQTQNSTVSERRSPDTNRILVVVDPTTDEQPAAERAAWLAGKTGAALELFICDYDQYLAGERFFDSRALSEARESLIANHKRRLREIAASLGGDDIAVDAAWDRPLCDGIVRKVLRSMPTLVAKDTHFHSVLKRSIFSNTDWNLIRDCPVPLLLVKPEDRGLDTVIAAVDPVHERDKPAQLDHEILRTAKAIAEAAGARLHVVHGFDPAPAYAMTGDSMAFPIATPIHEMTDALRQRHETAVRDLVESYEIPQSDVHIHEGETRKVLIDMAEKLNASLVVMGSVARGALRRVVLGSTAERVLDWLPCNLLIVKAPGFGTQVSEESEI